MIDTFWKRLIRTDARAFFWTVAVLLALAFLWWARWETRARRERAAGATRVTERIVPEAADPLPATPPSTRETAMTESPFGSPHLDETAALLQEERRRAEEEARLREEERRRAEQARRRAEEERRRAEEARQREEAATRAAAPAVEQEPKQEPEQEKVPPKAPPPRRIEFFYRGMMRRTDGVLVAFVEEGGVPVRPPVTSGQALAGWRVERIEAGRLVLSGEEGDEKEMKVGERTLIEERSP